MKAGLDIGNSRVKLALFEHESVQEVIYLPRESDRITQSIKDHGVRELIVTSVAGNLVDDVSFTQSLDLFIWLDHHTPLPIEINYSTPETLGRDRIASAAGANALYSNTPSLIFDIGTCMTIDLITAQGKFIGGNISPGLNMRYSAMNEFTSNLPMVSYEDLGSELGGSTKEALILGGLKGMINEIEGYCEEYSKQYEGLNVILTGGDGAFFAKKVRRKIFLHPNLVFNGLLEILNFNAA